MKSFENFWVQRYGKQFELDVQLLNSKNTAWAETLRRIYMIFLLVKFYHTRIYQQPDNHATNPKYPPDYKDIVSVFSNIVGICKHLVSIG
jgi:hypothetical protein